MSVMPVFSLILKTAFQVFPPSVVLYRPRSPPGDQSGPCDATYTTAELRGSIRIFAMCSEFFSPTFVHVFPASVDLYNPSPKSTLRCALFSPLPSQMTLELFGSIVTQP